LGTIPIIDLPLTGGRLILGEREGLLADLRLAGRSVEILDFRAEKDPASMARIPLKNHSLTHNRVRLSAESGKGMLLGREATVRRSQKPSNRLEQENAGGLY
jgi:hypothetical protein